MFLFLFYFKINVFKKKSQFLNGKKTLAKFSFFCMTNEQGSQLEILENREYTEKAPTKEEKDDDNDLPPNPLIFYLNDNLQKIKSPQFFRNATLIQHMPDENVYYIKNIIEKSYDHFIDSDTTIDNIKKNIINSSPNQNFTLLEIEWFTISHTQVKMIYNFLKSKIQLTAKSLLKSYYSLYTPQDLTKTESSIEVFANSTAIFKYCYFYDAQRVNVIARNFSTVIFDHCLFENNKISSFIMDDSYAKFDSCKFKNDQNISIFVTKNSRAEIVNCEFNGLQGKAIFGKESQIYIKNTKFINCTKGAATVAEKSSLYLDGQIYIENPSNTAIRAINGSHVKAIGVTVVNADGNGLNIDNSDGYFIDCFFKGTVHPTIAVMGRKSNPIFHKCTIIEDKNTFSVICKNCSRPLFDNCHFSGCTANCFSISDFSRPHIQNCSFENMKKLVINCFSDSFVTYENIELKGDMNISEKVHKTPNSKCCQMKKEDVEKLIVENLTNDENDAFTVRYWRSPQYDEPPKITVMPDIEKLEIYNDSIKPLKLANLNDIVSRCDGRILCLSCSNCKKELDLNSETMYIMTPCGHIFCENCVDAAERCPICDTLKKSSQRIFYEKTCAICLEKDSNTISLPCGHLCQCYECASKMSDSFYNCPMCNEPLSSYKYAFNDVKEDNMRSQTSQPQRIKILSQEMNSTHIDDAMAILENEEDMH